MLERPNNTCRFIIPNTPKEFWIWIGSWRCRDSRVSQNDHSPEATAAQPSTCHMLLPPVSQCTLGTVGSANTQPAAQSNYPNVYYLYHLCYNHIRHCVKYKTVQWVQFTGLISSSEVFICIYVPLVHCTSPEVTKVERMFTWKKWYSWI